MKKCCEDVSVIVGRLFQCDYKFNYFLVLKGVIRKSNVWDLWVSFLIFEK